MWKPNFRKPSFAIVALIILAFLLAVKPSASETTIISTGAYGETKHVYLNSNSLPRVTLSNFNSQLSNCWAYDNGYLYIKAITSSPAVITAILALAPVTNGFKIIFETGQSFRIQAWYDPNLFLTFTVQSGILNGTGTLSMTGEGAGTLTIMPITNATVTITASEGIEYTVNGERNVTSCTLESSPITIAWGLMSYTIPLDTYLLVGMGIFGFASIIFAPLYIVKKFKEHDALGALTIGFLIFIIGVGCVIVWLWE